MASNMSSWCKHEAIHNNLRLRPVNFTIFWWKPIIDPVSGASTLIKLIWTYKKRTSTPLLGPKLAQKTFHLCAFSLLLLDVPLPVDKLYVTYNLVRFGDFLDIVTQSSSHLKSKIPCKLHNGLSLPASLKPLLYKTACISAIITLYMKDVCKALTGTDPVPLSQILSSQSVY